MRRGQAWAELKGTPARGHGTSARPCSPAFTDCLLPADPLALKSAPTRPSLRRETGNGCRPSQNAATSRVCIAGTHKHGWVLCFCPAKKIAEDKGMSSNLTVLCKSVLHGFQPGTMITVPAGIN